jgi:hypothetical protein
MIFRASNSWLEAFRKRHNVRFRMLLGERMGMDQQVVANRKQNLPRIVQGYDKDIWNVDESGFFRERCAQPQLRGGLHYGP